MPSFDVVSEVQKDTLLNAYEQTKRELGHRYDFKGKNITITHSTEKEKHLITLEAPDEYLLGQLDDLFRVTFSKKGIDIGALKYLPLDKNLARATQKVEIRQGIEQEIAKKMVKLVKDSKLKVQASIQAEKLRITGKDRDELQNAIAFLREHKEIEIPLQFDNFRD